MAVLATPSRPWLCLRPARDAAAAPHRARVPRVRASRHASASRRTVRPYCPVTYRLPACVLRAAALLYCCLLYYV
jgi:hypothetical protein